MLPGRSAAEPSGHHAEVTNPEVPRGATGHYWRFRDGWQRFLARLGRVGQHHSRTTAWTARIALPARFGLPRLSLPSAAVTAARNTSVVTRASTAAGVLVAIVTVAVYLTDSNGSGAISMAGAINSLTSTSSVRQLVKEHQFILQLDNASQVLTRAANPVTVDAETLLNQPTTTTATTGGTGIAASAPPADPTAAEALGRELLAAAGFGTSGDWACLYSLWNRESGWNVYAENPSGAYGIPQAYPAYKMSAFGADWQTNPATQIKWGLSYVDGLYGGPCNAWDHEVSYGYY